MRAVTPAAAAVLAGPVVPMALLVDMGLSQPLRVCTWGRALQANGNTFLGAGELGSVEGTDESTEQPRQLRFSLSGVPTANISLALQEQVQGRPISLYVAVLDPATHAVLDAPLEWDGKLDTMATVEDGETGTVAVTAESAGLDLLRAVPVRYTDVDQQRLYPGDRFCEFITAQADAPVVWPAASFGRQ